MRLVVAYIRYLDCRRPLELFPDDFWENTDAGETRAKENDTDSTDLAETGAKDNPTCKEIGASKN